MKTTVIGSKGVETPVNKVGNGTTANVANNSGNGQKINNLPVSTQFDDKKDEPKKEEPKAEQPKAEEAKPQAEQSKKELKEQLREQQERKLAETVKLVEALGKKIAQKNKLQNTIANLDSFNITQNEEDDMASDSRFARCELVISDDDGNDFVTKNPFIIAYVAHEVKGLCIEKLAEVEADIVISF
jgi:flagellar motor protein MotB